MITFKVSKFGRSFSLTNESRIELLRLLADFVEQEVCNKQLTDKFLSFAAPLCGTITVPQFEILESIVSDNFDRLPWVFPEVIGQIRCSLESMEEFHG